MPRRLPVFGGAAVFGTVKEGFMAAEETKTGGRMLSVDVLRGFDMFWITGGTGFMLGVLRMLGDPVKGWIEPQMKHVDWEGFHFHDLIFPLFVFVVGMSVVFSLERILATDGRRGAYRRILRRFVIMYLLGVLYAGGVAPGDVRWMGVLQRLALCYLFAGLLFCHLGWRGMLGVAVGLLVGYWALLCFVPIPGRETVSFAPEENWANLLDAWWLPGRKNDGTWDPEGLLSTFPAVASALMGVLAALFLKSEKHSPARKAVLFLLAGAALVALGHLWGLQFPVIKKIWTSSYVLVSGGWSLVMLGLFYLVVDVWRIRWWTAPFMWIGVNPLTIYLIRNFMDFNKFADRFVGGNVALAVGEDWAYFLQMTVSVAFTFLVVWYLNRRKIYLRI